MLINDRDARFIMLRQAEAEIESTRTNDSPHGLEARANLATLPASDDRLRLAEVPSELNLGEPRPEPGFANQVATHHATSIVQICYITSSAGDPGRTIRSTSFYGGGVVVVTESGELQPEGGDELPL